MLNSICGFYVGELKGGCRELPNTVFHNCTQDEMAGTCSTHEEDAKSRKMRNK